jgi:hypothetical protein
LSKQAPTGRRLTDQEASMPKLARALAIGAMLAAMNLAGMTAIAQAHVSDEPASNQDARRPPTERQVGESWRHPANVPVRPAEPSSHPVSLLAWLGVLAVVLALAGGLAVTAARRASRKVGAGQTA